MGECKKVTIYHKLLTKNRNELLVVCKNGNFTRAERIIITNPATAVNSFSQIAS